MNIDFKNGLVIGLCCKACRFSVPESEPVAYLYGTPSDNGNIGLRVGDTVTYYDGAVLPKLPEWDTETYPHGIVTRWDTNLYALYTTPSYSYSKDETLGRVWLTVEGYERYKAEDGANEWTETWEAKTTTILLSQDGAKTADVKWANFKIEYDGTVYCSASDPIPVGEIVDYVDDIPIYEVIT